MPVVPTINAPQVAPINLPGAEYQTPTRFLAESQVPGEQLSRLGQGMQKAGDELMAEATRQQININEAAAKDYDTKLMAGVQSVLYGTPDAPGGYLNTKGKDAIDAFDAAAKTLGQLPQDLAKDLQNPAQAELVKNVAQQRIQSAIVHATTHRSQQSDVYVKTTGELRMKTAQDNAALAYNPISDTPAFDSENTASPYQQYLATVQAEARELAMRNGVTEEKDVNAVVRDATAKAYMGTLAHLIDRKGGNSADQKIAQAFFDAVKKELPAADQDKVRSVLEAGAQKDEALTLALKIKGSISDIAAQEKALDDKFAAGDIKAEVHNMALQYLRADNSQRRSEETEADKAFIGKVWDTARKGGTLGSLQPSDIDFIKRRGLGTQVDLIFKREERARKGDDSIDDTRLWSDLMRQMGDDPAGFASVDLFKVAPQLTNSHYDYLLKAQAGITRKDARAAAAVDAQKIATQAVTDTKAQLLASGFNLSPKPNTEAAKNLDTLTASLYDAVTKAQVDWADKKLTAPQMREEARKITLGMVKDQALAGTGYFGTTIGQKHKPVWKMTPEERAAPWDIPDNDRKSIADKLKAGGLPITDDNIQTYYKLSQGVR
jgi:hypothetical protein